MANGMTRNAISQIVLNGKNGNTEMNEEMDIINRGKGKKIDLKAGASSHNHSSESLHSRK